MITKQSFQAVGQNKLFDYKIEVFVLDTAEEMAKLIEKRHYEILQIGAFAYTTYRYKRIYVYLIFSSYNTKTRDDDLFKLAFDSLNNYIASRHGNVLIYKEESTEFSVNVLKLKNTINVVLMEHVKNIYEG